MDFRTIVDFLKDRQWENRELGMALLFIVIASIFTTPILGVPLGIAAYLYVYQQENIAQYKRNRDQFKK
ncbi:VraH family peptide resistance protein [Macrococcus equipercicus]|uniref:VraH family protein n=1 Tax=Macrococcus equipercicus TaxID=69967 RepID=A0A9Q9BSA0_9STAP|nr:VraH family protein [Macrococcus equipercicus]UTH13254.1 VraH family protein [Macrococcus equipercicus]